MDRKKQLIVALAIVLIASGCGLRGRDIPAVLPSVNGAKTIIFASNGERITELQGEERRVSIELDKIPVVLQNAVIAIEDERFWQHSGVDPKAILRAAATNTDGGGVSQGGSTITQQYIKNSVLGDQRNFQRKIEEVSLAYQMERTYSKNFILEQYLNTIYFGNRSYGVETAAQGYFGKSVSNVNIAEAATLAGLIQSPGRFDPYINMEGATTRRNIVLNKMHENGFISDGQYELAKASPITLTGAQGGAAQNAYPAPHFVEEVKRFIRTDTRFGITEAERNNLLVNGGLRIFTTIDLEMQAKAKEASRAVYPRKNRSITARSKDPDIGLVAIDPKTGFVRAMVGGYDYFDTDTDVHPYSQYNLAVGGGRQPGSTFKAVALARAVEQGISMNDRYPAPASAKVNISGYETKRVKGHALGRASLTECTVHSANTCFMYLTADSRVRPEGITEMASKLGINTSGTFKTVATEVLGVNNSTVLDMASAYGTFANNGVHVEPSMVTKIVRADGTVLFQHQHSQSKILEPEGAYDITKAMEQVLIRGTAEGKGLAFRPSAGKTGTTQDSTDGWFVGYTPQLVTAVWSGYAQTLPPSRSYPNGRLRRVGGSGASTAVPVWQRFMNDALRDQPIENFEYQASSVVTTTTVPRGNEKILEHAKFIEDSLTMPQLIGNDVGSAREIAAEAGLGFRRVDVSPPAGSRPGQVLYQSPAPGSPVVKGSTVTIEASPGDPFPKDEIPYLIGANAIEAIADLRARGFVVQTLYEASPPRAVLPSGAKFSSGQIWATLPRRGQTSADGRVVVRIEP